MVPWHFDRNMNENEISAFWTERSVDEILDLIQTCVLPEIGTITCFNIQTADNLHTPLKGSYSGFVARQYVCKPISFHFGNFFKYDACD